jgi:hypothetical protein
MKTQWAALCLVLGLSLPAAAEDRKLELSDGKLPLWELRPLDRRVYVISLDGAWKKPPAEGASYQLNVRFPDGQTYSHRPINDAMFFRGEMRFLVPEYMLVRSCAAKGGKLKLFVTERPSAGAKTETISNSLEVTWPLKRPIARRAPALKATPPPPIDAPPEEK